MPLIAGFYPKDQNLTITSFTDASGYSVQKIISLSSPPGGYIELSGRINSNTTLSSHYKSIYVTPNNTFNFNQTSF